MSQHLKSKVVKTHPLIVGAAAIAARCTLSNVWSCGGDEGEGEDRQENLGQHSDVAQYMEKGK